MKNLIKTILIATVIVLGSCSYKNNESIKPTVCVDTLVSFASQVNPIIEQNCTSCHKSGGTFPNLQGYDNVQRRRVNIVNSIKGENGFTKMPPSGSLNSCEINKIANWVNEGFKNN